MTQISSIPDDGCVVEVVLAGVEEDVGAHNDRVEGVDEAEDDHAVEVLAEHVLEPGAHLSEGR